MNQTNQPWRQMLTFEDPEMSKKNLSQNISDFSNRRPTGICPQTQSHSCDQWGYWMPPESHLTIGRIHNLFDQRLYWLKKMLSKELQVPRFTSWNLEKKKLNGLSSLVVGTVVSLRRGSRVDPARLTIFQFWNIWGFLHYLMWCYFCWCDVTSVFFTFWMLGQRSLKHGDAFPTSFWECKPKKNSLACLSGLLVIFVFTHILIHP